MTLEELKAAAQELDNKAYALEAETRKTLAEELDRVFKSCLKEGDVIESQGIYSYILRDNKEIISFNWREEDSYINFYSTWADSDWELDRLVTLGKVAGIFREKREELRQKTKTLLEQEIELKRPIWAEMRGISLQIREIEALQAQKLQAETRSKLLSGIEFIEPAKLQTRYSAELCGVVKLKVLKSTEKSATIETVRVCNFWDNSSNGFVLREIIDVTERVSWENIEYCLKKNKENIKKD